MGHALTTWDTVSSIWLHILHLGLSSVFNNPLFFHFSSFIDFILSLIICFRALAFSKADLSSLPSNSDFGTFLLDLSAFLVYSEFLVLDLSCSSTCFGYCPSLCFRLSPILAVLNADSTSIRPLPLSLLGMFIIFLLLSLLFCSQSSSMSQQNCMKMWRH